MEHVIISGKVLAGINMPDFCPRCFWIKQKVKNMPYNIFPGIFSSIDAYSKRVLHHFIDTHIIGPHLTVMPPLWFKELDGITGYKEVLWHTKFRRHDPVTNITVSGTMDDLYEHVSGNDIIPDYKTAKFTANADKLFPLYVGQLNSYKWIHEGFGNTVKSLLLVYCEPVTDESACLPEIFYKDGFHMKFAVKVLPVPMEDDLVEKMLAKARNIIDMLSPPEGTTGCKDCVKVDFLVSSLKGF